MKHKMSGAGRWVKCVASAIEEDRYPTLPASETTEEGLTAHAEAAICLRNEKDSSDPFIQEYIDAVRAYGKKPEIEGKVTWKGLTGYVDAWLIDNGCLHIWDFKFGYTLVEAEENWQLICYAAAILATLTKL
ncbi:MAG: DUF2800 domain-containing protein, partial [Desulfobacterales bacterium]|nr:DUF2800 domain-containing protein [Desulfobacterales bacterium]